MTIVILWCEVLLFDADDVMIITMSHMKSVTKVKFVIMFAPDVEGCFRTSTLSGLPVYRLGMAAADRRPCRRAAHEVAERARSRSLRVRPTGRPNWSTG